MSKHSTLKLLQVYLCIFGCLLITSNCSPQRGADASSASLIFNNNAVIVNPNERLDLECGVSGEYRSCIWEKGGSHQSLQVEDVHGGRIRGISKPENTKGNECGIVIENVDPSRHGEWTCRVFVIAKTLRGTKNVIVTVKPGPPTLEVNMNPLVVPENQDQDVTCTVAAARPPARIRWFAGSDDITAHSQTENTQTDDQGTYRSVSTLKYKFDHKYNRNMIRCSVEHYTLDERLYSEIPLDVRFHPYSISSTQFYGIPLENEYEIKFNLTSNPQPDARWIVGEQPLEVLVPSEVDRYQSRIVPLMDNVYMIGLKILDFTPEDISTSYKLIVSNEVGDRHFDINLSTGPAPPDGAIYRDGSSLIPLQDPIHSQDTMGTGTLIAIIVVVILIFLLIFIIVIMRYRQMYCFGPRDKVKDHLKTSGETLRDEHDTESAREPVVSSKTSPFKNIRLKFKRKDQKESKLENIEEGEVGGGGGVDNPARTRDSREGKLDKTQEPTSKKSAGKAKKQTQKSARLSSPQKRSRGGLFRNKRDIRGGGAHDNGSAVEEE